MDRLLSFLHCFHAQEDGAATVDWVVGTAAAVMLGIAVMNSVGNGAKALADKISATIAGIEFIWVPEETGGT
ncbi:hypothetical protein EU803_16250 [Loktanella sp. IMCC34160]|uniref:hypothetical protein n=1 Tax=Loktanella sp. IMCC34160 TaxID=2510646 RepID=UPI00101DE3FB|nr:hypothetical protein [Loktanella sp. IMCC34160]RYG89705.1 hypothetical protein EU803_16250 [Loktanella sp. IMCC34160]